MEQIPEIESLDVVLLLRENENYQWECTFTLKNEQKEYKMNVFCMNGIGKNRWDSGLLYQCDGKEWIMVRKTNTWYNHTMYQCITAIKKKSKYRLRLFQYLEIYTRREEFEQYEYEIPFINSLVEA